MVMALLQRQKWSPPQLRLAWLAILAFLPQLLVFYIPTIRNWIPDAWAAVGLVLSQVLLLVVCWGNRRQPGFWLLTIGLAMNLLVIVSNGGFMPISPQTASQLVPAGVLDSIQLGNRFGYGKDVLLLTEATHLPFLADRLLLPDGLPYQTAFSIGDVFIAFGAFLLMVIDNLPKNRKKDIVC